MMNSVYDILHNLLPSNSTAPLVQYATVTAVNDNRPVLRFAGDDTDSARQYASLKSYIPGVGDRVIVINDLIIGGWGN